MSEREEREKKQQQELISIQSHAIIDTFSQLTMSSEWPMSFLSVVLLLKGFDVTRNVSVRFKM